MKIIVHDYSGHPFQVQLSRSLARNGHDILHIYFPGFQTPKGNLLKTENDPPSFNIVAVKLDEPFEKYSFIKRYFQEITYGNIIVNEIKKFKPDLVINSNVPLDPLYIITNFCKKNSISTIFWWQDVYSVAITKILKEKFSFLGFIIGTHYKYKEKSIIKKSNYIIGITEKFKDVLIKWNLSDVVSHKYITIPNWAPIDEIKIEPKQNDWSVQYNLSKTFNFIYTGTLSYKHNPDIIIELAKSFLVQHDVRIIVTSEGIGADYLLSTKEKLQVSNLIIMPFQDFEVYSKVLGTADVLISVLEKDAGSFSVPSKVLSYLASGKPILLAVPLDNLASLIIQENKSGLVSDTLDTSTFIDNAWELYRNSRIRINLGESSRFYAEKNFNINSITEKFSFLFNKLNQ